MRRVASEDRRRAGAPAFKRTSSEKHHRTSPAPPRPQRSNSLSALYPSRPISSYYALNLSILQAFDSLYGQHQYQVAYAMGMQFIETALLEIPRHGYFYSPKYAKEKEQSSLEAERVCHLLQDVIGEEAQQEQERLEKLAKLAREQRLATSASPYCTDADSWSDLVVCSDAIQQYLCPIPEKKDDDKCGSPAVVPLEEGQAIVKKPRRRRSKREKEPSFKALKPKELVLDEADMDKETTLQREAVFEPPEKRVDEETISRTQDKPTQQGSTESRLWWEDEVTPVNSIQDYEETLSASESADLERALFLSGLDVRQQNDLPHGPPTKAPGEIDLASLKICFQEDFLDSLNTGRVRISRISTHQGRLVGSINGCTVIAPLLCIHHFSNELDDASWPDPGLPDAVLEHVIDEETCGMLPQVRDELGLTKDALIIPSDVHDFLMDRGLLMQQQFVTVCGGNILNEAHLQEMVNSIVNVPDKFAKKKIAATLFFHEHVVAILKLDRGNGTTWFDVIDSLPYEDTMNAQAAFSSPSNDVIMQDAWQEDYVPYAARIRCLDVDALRATLRWYACSKFNETDASYIDNYAWDDGKSDFDPRVFQAFVWAEA